MGSLTSIYVFACVFLSILWNNIQPTVENKIIANYSGHLLTKVPKNIPVHTHVLDLSHNNISEITNLKFIYLPDLQVLNLSHNLITELDFSVFIFNQDLEYLDLSHNNIWTAYCQMLARLRHLDLSFNKFTVLPVCQEFGIMFHLEYLGLSTRMIRRSDFRYVTHLQLNTVFLTLEDFSLYEPLSLTALNTKNLHIVFAADQNFNFSLLYDGMSTSEKLKIFNLRYTLSHKDFPSPSLELLKNIKATDLMLDTVDLEWTVILQIFLLVWDSTVEHLTVRNLIFRGPVMELTEYKFASPLRPLEQFLSLGGSMKALTLEHVRNKVYYFNQEHLYRLFSEMNIDSLTIYDACMPHMLCPQKTSSFQYINFSRNALTDELFQNCDTLANLKLLILNRNKFKSLSKVSFMTSRMKSLRYLDMSSNLLRNSGAEKRCQWTDSLSELDLSSNQLTESVFECLPVNINKLDLQNNQIASVPTGIAELQSLKELNLWTQAKRRAWHDCPEGRETVLQFHAFISYSERDSLWVKNELIPNLEKGEGCIQLCQHERNFIPGKSIVENIINCIEKSYKSIFVLSPNFVQSEWCHYELYFAHHKLFSENSNSLVLILLEPIPPYVIPARYHKLKALMAKRTYLEWPKERSKRALFWANLRAAISIKLPTSFETDEEQSEVTSTSSMTQPLIK
ncbi:LOW QUALITY PROTEIN: toll-like receptor 6 [Meleagris gallopavo]|uniref:LOW QUALITY PROTEIN: toll-like receptor 6 n=1 Tax=Meleagris gallopavo TaxID=9103 RepID=UPI00093B1F38|nr:LOW QUALITY PROTEIN: toll-like receptor 6 [Meleagris gallopavo]